VWEGTDATDEAKGARAASGKGQGGALASASAETETETLSVAEVERIDAMLRATTAAAVSQFSAKSRINSRVQLT
jgi:hypothetical protein